MGCLTGIATTANVPLAPGCCDGSDRRRPLRGAISVTAATAVTGGSALDVHEAPEAAREVLPAAYAGLRSAGTVATTP